jgi:two-component system LytT family response regulator
MKSVKGKMQNGYNKKIAIPTIEGLNFITLHEIIYCRAVKNYTQFSLKNGNTLLSSYTLKHFEEMLEASGFSRVHRSHLINLFHLSRYARKGTVLMSDGSEIEVSRTYRDALLEKIKKNFEW